MSEDDQNLLRTDRSRDNFPTTHWSVVLTAANPAAPQSTAALDKFCRAYWRPVYVFIRRQTESRADALDLTQEFFARFLEKEQVRLVDPKRGRLRSFLLTSIQNFLINQRVNAQAQKRGGGLAFLSLEAAIEADTHFVARVADPATTPGLAYEQEWAFTILNDALDRLRRKSAATCGLEQFDALKDFVWSGSTTKSQAEIGAQLGMTANAVAQLIHRLRRRYGELLREAVGRTVSDPGEIDDELRHLIAVLGS